MGKTLASLAIRLADGTMESIKVYNYCRPEQMGVMLLLAYKDRRKIWQMIQLGYLVSVGWEVGDKVEEIEKFGWDGTRDAEVRKLQNKQCLAHIRDWGRCPEFYGTKKHKDKLEWSIEFADHHRYYFVTDTTGPDGGGEWFYDPPGTRYDEEKGKEVPHSGQPLDWEIDLEELTSKMKKVHKDKW